MKKLIFIPMAAWMLVGSLLFSSCGNNLDFTACEAHAKNCPKAENCPEHPTCEAHERCAKAEDCKEHPVCEAFEHKKGS